MKYCYLFSNGKKFFCNFPHMKVSFEIERNFFFGTNEKTLFVYKFICCSFINERKDLYCVLITFDGKLLFIKKRARACVCV